ncbi:MAG: hypothetical protein Q9173_005236 [Seirophora scorigena]
MPLYNLSNPSPTQPSLPDPLPSVFTLRTPHGRDLWRKPPSTNDFNAPLLLRTLPLSSLKSARVSVTAQWTTKFDQGGLVLVLNGKPGSDEKQRRWIKTGIELFEGVPNLSTVATDREIMDGEKTSTLWVYSVHPATGDKRPLREVTWVFEEENLQDDALCEIGVYAAKPNPDKDNSTKEFDVTFEGLQIETW